jgi:competence protein ComEC
MIYLALVAFAIGVGIATLLAIPLTTIVWLLFLAFAVAVLRARTVIFQNHTVPLVVSIVLVCGAFGMLRTEWHERSLLAPSLFSEQVGESIVFSGEVVAEPDVRNRTTQLHVRSGTNKILVSVDRHTAIAYGDEILVSGELRIPESFETDLGRTFDYPGYLLARGITYTVSFADTAVISTGNGNPIIAFLLKTKHRLMSGIESVIEEPQAGLAEGLLLGVKQALGDDIEESFRMSGIIHIVVLSGYNVMLVVAFFMFFLAPLPRRVKMVLGILAITGFALLVGLSATVVRASIMASLFLLADTFSKTYSVLRTLFFAGVAMILINPYLLLYDIGFQLSFMATLGLVLVTPHFETTMSSGALPQWREYVLATIATQIAVLPLLLYHIGEVSLVAVIVNLLVLPVVPLAMFGSFVAGLTAPLLYELALLFAYPTSWLLSYIIIVATWFAALPFATILLPLFSPLYIPLLYAAIAAAYWYVFYRRSSDTNSLHGWEVIAEEDVLPTKNATVMAASPEEKDIPIFFR